MRLSGLQREVLSLYRKCLREIRKKPAVSGRLSSIQSSEGRLTTSDIGRSEQLQELRQVWLHTDAEMLDLFYLTGCIVSRGEFMKNIALDKKDFSAIEYHLRRGQRQLEIYSSPRIKNILR